VKTEISEMLGCEYPIIAFSHCRDVIAAVTAAGGYGVLGAAGFTAAELEVELKWLDEHTHGRGYGLDLLIPAKHGMSAGTPQRLEDQIPAAHREFLDDLLARYDVPPLAVAKRDGALGTNPSDRARELWNVAFEHPVTLFASALGAPPEDLVQAAHRSGAKVAGLVGKKAHARHQQDVGVDFVVAQGYEAGGHTGEITTMVLVPEIVDEVSPLPVVAAGGIASGRQMGAALALGAAGVWTGSVWLTTEEAETHPVVKQKFLAATSSDTLRSRASTGKPARQLRSAWTDEWESPDNPEPLQMPFHGHLTREARARIEGAAHRPGSGAEKLINYYVGQVVGQLSTVKSARQVLHDIVEELADVTGNFVTLAERS
jgi:NAD(P)H-dependent flavin oxidoreductase YrpB (nitropropane dioxygenase family)